MPEIGNSPIIIHSYYSDRFDTDIHARQCLMLESNCIGIALMDKQEILAFEEFAFEDLNAELFLQSKIAALKQSLPAIVICRTDTALLLPEAFSRMDNDLTGKFFSLSDGRIAAEYKPASFPAIVKFPVQKKVLGLLKKQFPGVVIMHHSVPVFMWMMHHSKLKHSSFLVEQKPERLFIYAVRDGKPLFYNSFEANSPEDLAYYTMFAMEQLEMDPVKQTVYFKIDRQNEKILSVCRNFIPALVSLDLLNPVKQPETELLFPFLIHASSCE